MKSDRALQRADVQLVIEPGTPPTYRFDPTRAESRLARRAVDDALQRAAGPPRRVHGARSAGRNRGLALHRLARARAARHEHHEHGPVGPRLLDRHRADAEAAQAPGRVADAPARLPARAVVRAARVPRGRGRRAAWRSAASPSACRCAARGRRSPSPAWWARLSFGGLGLLVASRARTVEAVSGLLNLVMLPMWLLSGVFFASSNFPAAMQPFIRALPLTALNESLRAVMLEGADLAAIGGPAPAARRVGRCQLRRGASALPLALVRHTIRENPYSRASKCILRDTNPQSSAPGPLATGCHRTGLCSRSRTEPMPLDHDGKLRGPIYAGGPPLRTPLG